VFDPVDGRLRDVAMEDSIFCIRQICLMWKKIGLPCSNSRIRKTLNGYVTCESELSRTIDSIPSVGWAMFGQTSDVLWSETLGALSERTTQRDLRPSHGPGATAERVFGNAKYNLREWHDRLQLYFPFDAYGHSRPDGDDGKGFAAVEFREPGTERPTRVVTVPKTLRGPRVIGIEPVCMQYIQQSVLRELVKSLERSGLTAGQLNFTDQSINSKLALESSRSGKYATIDLSDASDRVHKDCVYRMLESVPDLRNAIFACRSHSACLPDGTIVPLYKFASMGSALCFPIESMMFYTLCISARLLRLSLRPTKRNILKVSRDVYIYGDDIIIPVDEVPKTIELLESFGLKVNTRKTFFTGKFRESCGMDAYNGVNVTPVYVRCLPPSSLQDASAIVSFVSLANQLFTVGLWGTARYVRELVESHAGFPLPYVRDTASCLGWINTRSAYSFMRYSKDTQAPEVRSLVVRVSEKSDPLSGYPALMKFFLKVGEKPIQGKHLERTVRPGSVNIKTRWAQPF
jgi:hypothetical protein